MVMREIKFRAWDKQFQIITKVLPDGYKFTFDGKVILLDHRGKEIGESQDFILMQYTGLKDKNGKEIYEGDIVDYELVDGNKIFEIKYREDMAKFVADGKDFHAWGLNQGDVSERTEIIGNIYENPELLGE